MKEKTKNYKWLPWALAIAVAATIGMLMAKYNYSHWHLLEPWSDAEGLVTKLAISTFQGMSEVGHHWDARVYAMLGMVLSFIIGPSLWIYAEIKHQVDNEGSIKSQNKGAVWYIGIVVVMLSLQVVPSAIMKVVVSQDSKESIAASKNEDELRMGLMRLGLEAYERYYLPHEFGGGAQNFRSIPTVDNDMRAISLTDLENYDESAHNSYQLAPVKSDSVIAIYGVGYKSGPDPVFKNINGQKGRLQMGIEVTPQHGVYHFLHKNVNGQ